jgi:hypothetical protein
VPQTNLVCISLSNILVLVKLCDLLLLHCVDLEMLIGDDHLFVKVVDLFLFHLGQLFHHVVARDEDSVEVLLLRECGPLRFNLGLEVWLSVGPWHKLEALHLLFGVQSLKVVRDLQVVDRRLIWLLGVLVPILTLHHVVEAILRFPVPLILFLGLLLNFIFVHDGEGETQMLS